MIDQLAPYSEPLQWFATLTAIGAALTVSLNLGARITGWAFVVFTASSLAWIAIGLIQGEPPLTLQNVVLTVINVIGIYRWLWIKAPEEDEMQVEEARLEEVETLAERAAAEKVLAVEAVLDDPAAEAVCAEIVELKKEPITLG